MLSFRMIYMSCSMCLTAKARYILQDCQHPSCRGFPLVSHCWPCGLFMQLCANSGVLQSIATGDSILAPVGKAWCQLQPGTEAHSDLAVLKLLVPGGLPSRTDTAQQGNGQRHTCFSKLLAMCCSLCIGCSKSLPSTAVQMSSAMHV